MGRIVFITGGGTGLGLACAMQFYNLGDHVCISGRRENVLAKAVEFVQSTGDGSRGGKIFWVRMDVKKADDVEATIDRIVEVTGDLPSVILNNAAGNFACPTEKLSPNAWKSVVDIVFLGGVYVLTGVGKRWVARRSEGLDSKDAHTPNVVFLSVGTSYMDSGPYLAPSACSKAGIRTLNQTLAAEWGKYNMRFVMVAPGPIYTEGAMSRLDPMGMSNLADPTDRVRVGKSVPLGYMVNTDEYAAFMATMASDTCRWLNGTVVQYDGGSFANGGEMQMMKEISKDEWAMMTKTSKGKAAKQKKGELENIKRSKI